MTKTANTPREVSIQVPGDAAPVVEQDQGAEAQPVRRTRPQEDQKAESAGVATVVAEIIPDDVMALARAQVRAEMSRDVKVEEEADPLPVATRRSYAKMRAADIDPAKLTAPVMTLDGWLCPPAPEKK